MAGENGNGITDNSWDLINSINKTKNVVGVTGALVFVYF